VTALDQVTLTAAVAALLLSACSGGTEVLHAGESESPSQTAEVLFASVAAGKTLQAAQLFDSAVVLGFQNGLAAQTKHLERQGLKAGDVLPPTLELADLDRLSAPEVLARYLEHVRAGFGFADVTVVGHVLENDTLAHVVFGWGSAADLGTRAWEPVQVLTLVLRPAGWRVRAGEVDRQGLGYLGVIVGTPTAAKQ
jgi:hypothetical protein